MWWFVAIVCLIQATASSEELTRRIRDVNPETHMNISESISYKGYPSEEYEVLTDDGYYLAINRIPGGKNNLTITARPKPVVLLGHGILAESKLWMINMANKSLPFILADAGYDVWLGNNRGTAWSKKHLYLSADQEEFWDFSFHEMAMYDLPGMINFILKKTGQEQLHYIGDSQGCAIGFIAFSTMPELAKKIKMFFALAPVVSVKHVPSPAVKLLSSVSEHTIKDIFGKKDFTLLNPAGKTFLTKLCNYGFMNKLCNFALLFAGGFNAGNINMSQAEVLTSCFPDTTSIKNLLHWRQTGESGFRYFDYGSENQVRYNQSIPPSYKVEDMMVPTAVWSGGKDMIANPENMENLISRITNLVYYCHFPDWTHWDFVGGMNAPQRMYYKVVEMIERSL
ncbi:lysosomal acid lipase/cholesteryl ester hydrolase-like [Hemicordylus capensis]|uniref:lysosomal acid lipase/cholesteryl ester hydrolase-like n=1 Tax=Hemicordylus capensis TaxID=884348 RepID=UPI002304A83A|nr:lysosomal acid lipase/cholesteryl ester hydrolase-like [Hemicordylus capensis]